MAVDWLEASEEDRQRLYVVTRDVAAAANMSVEAVLDAALGGHDPIGTDYIANFRKGKIRRAFAKMVYEWIAEHHQEKAHKLNPDLFPKPHTDVWDDFLEDHAIRGRLKLVRFERASFGLVESVRNIRAEDEVVQLDQPFFLQIESPNGGYAAAFQIYAGEWHSFPLRADGSTSLRLEGGNQIVPITMDGRPDPIVERHDNGPHRFIVVVAPQRDALPKLHEPPRPSDNVE